MINNPDLEFILHSGDIVVNGGESEEWVRHAEDNQIITDNNITVYYAVGNHECYNYAIGSGQYASSDSDLSLYMANVELPGNEQYYSFDYNCKIHFVFMYDCENSGSNQVSEEQKIGKLMIYELTTLKLLLSFIINQIIQLEAHPELKTPKKLELN